MKLEKINPEKLSFAEYNPRSIKTPSLERLKKSLSSQNGVSLFERRPILVNKRDGKLIVYAGNQRLKAARELGIKEVPVIIDEISIEEEKERNIKDNLSVGDWDSELLEANFDLKTLEEWGMDLQDVKLSIEPEEEKDEVPEPPKEARAKLGEVYTLGRHRLMCGDSTMIDDVEKLMAGKKADLFITDPPYNVEYVGKTKDALTIQNDKQTDTQFRQFLKDAFSSADMVMKGGAVFYIWHADSEGFNFRGACADVSWKVRQCLIWNKSHMVMGRQDYHWKHEPCLYGWKDGDGHLWNSDRKQVTVLDFERPTKNKEHPTMKPLNLIAYQIGNNTKNDDLVLDLFLGSGSTLIAAQQTGRICHGMELDPRYCDVIIKRYCNLTGANEEEIYSSAMEKAT